MQPGIASQLVEDKLRNVFSRYGSSVEVGEIRQRPDRVAAGLVIQDRWANDNPVEPAVSDDRFLSVLVSVHFAQQKWKDQVVEEKAAVPGTVAGANPCDAD